MIPHISGDDTQSPTDQTAGLFHHLQICGIGKVVTERNVYAHAYTCILCAFNHKTSLFVYGKQVANLNITCFAVIY